MKQIKIIFEKEVEDLSIGIGIWKTEKAQGFVSFSDLNTKYDTGMSYRDNFVKFIRDSFECGFVFLDGDYAIPVFKILAFMAVKEPSDKEIKTDVVPTEKVSEKSCPNTNRQDKRMRRHGRWRNFKKMKNPNNQGSGIAQAGDILKNAKPLEKEEEHWTTVAGDLTEQHPIVKSPIDVDPNKPQG